MENENNNLFGMEDIFPNADAIFSHALQPVEKIRNDCFVVLDTNVLLFPYKTGKTTLDQISKIYKSLIERGRLIVPGQVAREFAKNRGNKISELFQQISRKSSDARNLKNETYPLLASLKESKEMQSLEREINERLAKYRATLGQLLNQISTWHWNDPVTKLYRELFSTQVVLDIEQNEGEFHKELERRFRRKIPPGYQDAAKPDSGIGDLVIWYTILNIAEQHKKSVIFVSGDEKADWQIQSEGQALYPRYELIDEFRQKSNGASFYILSFSNFLELFNVSETVIAEVRSKELPTDEIYSRSFTSTNEKLLKPIYQFLTANYPDQYVKPSDDDVDFEIIYSDGSKIGVGLMFNPSISDEELVLTASKMSALARKRKYKNIIVAIIFAGREERMRTVDFLEKLNTRAMISAWKPHTAFLVSHIDSENTIRIDHFE